MDISDTRVERCFFHQTKDIKRIQSKHRPLSQDIGQQKRQIILRGRPYNHLASDDRRTESKTDATDVPGHAQQKGLLHA